MERIKGCIETCDGIFPDFLGALKAHLEVSECKCDSDFALATAAIRSLKARFPQAGPVSIPRSVKHFSKYAPCDCKLLALFQKRVFKRPLPQVSITERRYVAPEDRIPDNRWFTDEGLRMMRAGFMKDVGERYR